MPPQWQGSEDILVPPPGELEAEEEAEEEGVEDDPDTEELEEELDGPKIKRVEIVDSEDELAL